MRTIIACTDGSIYATSVYDHAAWAAQRIDARIHVLHVLEPQLFSAPFVDASAGFGIDGGIALKEELIALEETRGRIEQARSAALLGAARQHLEESGIRHLRTESAHGALVESVTRPERAADLIVIGKRGQGADFARMHLGSNIERVIRACRQPVLVASRAFRPVNRMLIAFDGGVSAWKAIGYAGECPLLHGLECLLLAVGRPVKTIEDDIARAASQLHESGVRAEVIRRPGNPEEVIPEVVRAANVDLLVMGAYGHSRIRHLIVGSTTSQMVRSCLLPVLMFS